MFERRLKMFLFLLTAMTGVLAARAVQLQILENSRWTTEAIDSLHHVSLRETTRGQLLDVKGRPLAENVVSYDACVDYRAITSEPDPKWVHDIAAARLKSRDGGQRDRSIPYRKQLSDEIAAVRADIDAMWAALADEGGLTPDQIDDLRQAIVHDVEMRRRYTWYRRYRLAQDKTADHPGSGATTQDAPPPWYRKWLSGESDTAPVDNFDITIGEQTQPHIILRSISARVYNQLGKEQEHFPGLVLRPGMARSYPMPFAEAACHVLGRLTRVDENDLDADPFAGDELRAYHQSDLIGRGGLEGLCEPLLRGVRGKVEEWSAEPSDEVGSTDANGSDKNPSDSTADSTGDPANPHEQVVYAIPGKDVRCTIDADLEEDIRGAFDHVDLNHGTAGPPVYVDMHGAAVVIDVPSGEVRAMVSAPGYDPNDFDRRSAELADDFLNHPLLNRATEAMLETGSTIKPLVGIGAITQGVMGINDTIKCDGYLWIGGRQMPTGRCWTMSEWNQPGHVIPYEDPHPTGLLTFPDALQRSCNVFFENMGDRLGIEGLSYWMRTFGLGRITGVGIAEARGRLPDSIPASFSHAERRSFSWRGGIGQGYVAATPIQMANVAATIARGGVWMRPRLVSDDISRQLRAIAQQRPATTASTQPQNVSPSWMDVPDRAPLNLSPAAVAAAQEGMWRVVNTFAGTGQVLFREDLEVSGKTGTAQAAPFWVPLRDARGKIIMNGSVPAKRFLRPSTTTQPNSEAPWYLGFDEMDKKTARVELKHAWFIGYTPSHAPRIAFAVLVEYGGSGGTGAGGIAKQIIAACIKHGYVPVDSEMHALVK
jgi:penicillin-binding protein 2